VSGVKAAALVTPSAAKMRREEVEDMGSRKKGRE
jgi:hypothetical protein